MWWVGASLGGEGEGVTESETYPLGLAQARACLGDFAVFPKLQVVGSALSTLQPHHLPFPSHQERGMCSQHHVCCCPCNRPMALLCFKDFLRLLWTEKQVARGEGKPQRVKRVGSQLPLVFIEMEIGPRQPFS